MYNILEIIDSLELKPHPEGGFFKETYRSKGTIKVDSLDAEYEGERNYSTSIYFMLTSEKFSSFHKINQDEIWHFYQGSPIELHTISESGIHKKHIIGNDLMNAQKPQLVVPGNHWFAAKVIDPDSYSLVGCTVSPGFDFEDFTLAERDVLIQQFPEHKELIKSFTRVD